MVTKHVLQKYLRPLAPIATALKPRGELRDRIECVLFDIYGTLFISASGEISLIRQGLHGVRDLQQLMSKFAVRGSPQTLLDEFNCVIEAEHAEGRRHGVDFPEVDIEAIWTQILRIEDKTAVRQFALEFELIANPVYPMPHLEDLLTACRRLGLLMGIISNAQFYTPCLFSWFLNKTPEDLGFDPDLQFYSYRFSVAKPSRVLFDMAAEILNAKGIQPSSVLYLGNDMLNDIYPAGLSEFQTALFAGDQRSLRLRTDDPRCRHLTADLVITDLKQLSEHLARQIESGRIKP